MPERDYRTARLDYQDAATVGDWPNAARFAQEMIGIARQQGILEAVPTLVALEQEALRNAKRQSSLLGRLLAWGGSK